MIIFTLVDEEETYNIFFHLRLFVRFILSHVFMESSPYLKSVPAAHTGLYAYSNEKYFRTEHEL